MQMRLENNICPENKKRIKKKRERERERKKRESVWNIISLKCPSPRPTALINNYHSDYQFIVNNLAYQFFVKIGFR